MSQIQRLHCPYCHKETLHQTWRESHLEEYDGNIYDDAHFECQVCGKQTVSLIDCYRVQEPSEEYYRNEWGEDLYE